MKQHDEDPSRTTDVDPITADPLCMGASTDDKNPDLEKDALCQHVIGLIHKRFIRKKIDKGEPSPLSYGVKDLVRGPLCPYIQVKGYLVLFHEYPWTSGHYSILRRRFWNGKQWAELIPSDTTHDQIRTCDQRVAQALIDTHMQIGQILEADVSTRDKQLFDLVRMQSIGRHPLNDDDFFYCQQISTDPLVTKVTLSSPGRIITVDFTNQTIERMSNIEGTWQKLTKETEFPLFDLTMISALKYAPSAPPVAPPQPASAAVARPTPATEQVSADRRSPSPHATPGRRSPSSSASSSRSSSPPIPADVPFEITLEMVKEVKNSLFYTHAVDKGGRWYHWRKATLADIIDKHPALQKKFDAIPGLRDACGNKRGDALKTVLLCWVWWKMGQCENEAAVEAFTKELTDGTHPVMTVLDEGQGHLTRRLKCLDTDSRTAVFKMKKARTDQIQASADEAPRSGIAAPGQ